MSDVKPARDRWNDAIVPAREDSKASSGSSLVCRFSCTAVRRRVPSDAHTRKDANDHARQQTSSRRICLICERRPRAGMTNLR